MLITRYLQLKGHNQSNKLTHLLLFLQLGISVIVINMLLMSWAAHASPNRGDPEVGATKVEICATCHGVGGAKPIANYPIIAGQHQDYLIEALKQYRNGRRSNAIMAPQAVSLSDQDILDISAYYSQQDSPLY